MCVYRYYGWLYISGFVPCTRHSGRVICFFNIVYLMMITDAIWNDKVKKGPERFGLTWETAAVRGPHQRRVASICGYCVHMDAAWIKIRGQTVRWNERRVVTFLWSHGANNAREVVQCLPISIICSQKQTKRQNKTLAVVVIKHTSHSIEQKKSQQSTCITDSLVLT